MCNFLKSGCKDSASRTQKACFLLRRSLFSRCLFSKRRRKGTTFCAHSQTKCTKSTSFVHTKVDFVQYEYRVYRYLHGNLQRLAASLDDVDGTIIDTDSHFVAIGGRAADELAVCGVDIDDVA